MNIFRVVIIHLSRQYVMILSPLHSDTLKSIKKLEYKHDHGTSEIVLYNSGNSPCSILGIIHTNKSCTPI